jgi:hypothetical protein
MVKRFVLVVAGLLTTATLGGGNIEKIGEACGS